MSRKFLTPIDLTNLEILNLRLQQTTPGTLIEGLTWYDTTNDRPMVRDASASQIIPFIGAGTPGTIGVADSAAAGTSLFAARLDHAHASPALATGSVAGFMSAADKTKLDAATSAATASTLVLRDGSSRFQAADPSAAADVATKSYVDAAVTGLDVKASCRVATAAALPAYSRTANVITASANGALAAIDGVTLVLNDRLLLKDGAAGADNGLYFVSQVGTGGTPYTLTRTTDADNSPAGEVTSGMYTFIEEGTTLASTGWILTTANPITLNTTALVFTQFSGAGTYLAGTGLTLTGNTFSISASYVGQTSITTIGTITTGTWSATTIATTRGGTGLTSYTTGDILYASGANTLSALSAAAAGEVLISGTTPSWGKVALTTHVSGTLPVANGGTNASTALSGSSIMISNGTSIVQGAAGTTTTVLHGNAGGAPTYGAVSLTADVSGTLPAANGGTGVATYAVGDLLQASGATTLSVLAAVATGNVLLSGGVATVSSWGKVGLTTHVSGVLPVANGGTNSSTALSGSSIMISNGSAVVQGAAGTTTTVLHGNAGGAPTYGAVSLTADVSGTLPSANGGTGFATYATGDIVYASATDTLSKLTVGTAGQVLTVAGGVPTWAAAAAGVIRAAANVAITTSGVQIVITTGVTAATPIVQVYEVASGLLVECDVDIVSSTQLGLTFAVGQAADTYRWVLLA